MAIMFTKEITKYWAMLIAGDGDKKAYILAISDDVYFYINFYKEGVTLPANSYVINSGQKQVYLSYRFDLYEPMIDLMRNEKPVYIFYRDDLKLGYTKTNLEDIGEEESQHL